MKIRISKCEPLAHPVASNYRQRACDFMPQASPVWLQEALGLKLLNVIEMLMLLTTYHLQQHLVGDVLLPGERGLCRLSAVFSTVLEIPARFEKSECSWSAATSAADRAEAFRNKLYSTDHWGNSSALQSGLLLHFPLTKSSTHARRYL